MPEWIEDYVGAANDMMTQLQDNVFMTVTGTSNVDFSNLIDGMMYV